MNTGSELVLNTDDFKGLFDRVRNLEINDKVKDEKIDTLISITKETLTKIDDHAKTFKLHDEKEMKKYDISDKHIVELTNTMNIVAKDMNSVADTLKKHETLIADNKKSADEKFEIVVEKQNKFLGGIAVLIVSIGIVSGLISYINTKNEENTALRLEKQTLAKEVNQLKVNSGKQYQMIKSMEKGK
jgi:hypothetical protein